MDKDVKKLTQDAHDALNFLGESSHEYYYYYDFGQQTAFFSRNMREYFALPLTGADTCTSKQLYEIVHPQDLPIVRMQGRRLSRGQDTMYEGRYRLLTRTGNYVWVTSCGRCQIGKNGHPRWMIGRITPNDPESGVQPGVFDLNRLKQDAEIYLEEKTPASLLVVGVDDLHAINLRQGRRYGDSLLAQLRAAFDEAVYGQQRIYHTVGDCFAAILPDNGTCKVEDVFHYIQKRMEDCCTISGGCVSFLTYRIPDAETLYQYAEVALATAKRQGKHRIAFFSAEDYEKELRVLELKDELTHSTQQDFSGFSVVYQPQVRTNDLSLYGAEALLRYHSEQQGDLSPTDFIPLLEQSGLISKVGLWLLRQALTQCSIWRRTMPEFHVSVNLSFAQLYQRSIVRDVLDAVRESGLPGNALTLEVTESLELVEYTAINEIFRQWKQQGIEISVDDFGTGYSSLSRLKDLDVDEIKIDGIFVSSIQSSAYSYRLLNNMIQLADSGRIRVCCEGVESESELRIMRELGPTLLQGYLISRPCTPARLEELFLQDNSQAFRERQARFHRFTAGTAQDTPPKSVGDESELALKVLNSDRDIYYISDPETYELYYLNPAGQSLFGVHQYQGRKCYQVLQGRDTPCPNCTNSQLRQDSFYVWDNYNEYCKRRFLLRDKLIEFRGRRVRLEIAADITKHENVSRDTGERLAFAQKIVDNTAILAGNTRYEEAVDQVLASVGQYYHADRAYLFEPTPSRPGFWDNTFEWCAPGVEPQHDNLQRVPPEFLRRWMDRFEQERSIFILNLDPIRQQNPAEWESLHAQKITRLIAVPLRDNGHTIGFIGVDNPRTSIRDDSQIRVLAHFLITRLHQERSERRYQRLLRTENRELLRQMGMGFWVMILDPASGARTMLADDTMYQAMGADGVQSGAEFYQFWHARITPGYYDYAERSIQDMVDSGKVVQMEYTWQHPTRGNVMMRCTGVRTADEGGRICLKGYHRIVDDVELEPYIPASCARDIFEYNEPNGWIFFHTRRYLLYGDAQREQNFPQCWIRERMVHPDSADSFAKAFSHLRLRRKVEQLQVQLRAKSGQYVWYRLTMQHLGQKPQDMDTVLILVEPLETDRSQEAEYLRMRRFYHAMLAETIAYAEVNLDRDTLQAAGGVWSYYEKEYLHTGRHFFRDFSRALASKLRKDDEQILQQYLDPVARQQLMEQKNLKHRFYYQRNMHNELHWVELTICPFQESMSGSMYALLYLKDISAERKRDQAWLKDANLDALTGVYNRRAFEREMTRSIAGPDTDHHGYLLLLDVDDFQKLNNAHGHIEGDAMLKIVASQLLQTFRRGDVIGRMSGDEFLVYLRGSIPRKTLEQRLNWFRQQLQLNSGNALTCSMGLTCVDGENFVYARSLGQADNAVYYSKRHGKNRYTFYEDLSS